MPSEPAWSIVLSRMTLGPRVRNWCRGSSPSSGPKGMRGPQGPQGDTGPIGDTGPQGDFGVLRHYAARGSAASPPPGGLLSSRTQAPEQLGTPRCSS